MHSNVDWVQKQRYTHYTCSKSHIKEVKFRLWCGLEVVESNLTSFCSCDQNNDQKKAA